MLLLPHHDVNRRLGRRRKPARRRGHLGRRGERRFLKGHFHLAKYLRAGEPIELFLDGGVSLRVHLAQRHAAEVLLLVGIQQTAQEAAQ